MRSMCLILLRRLLSKDWDEVWPIWGEENQKGFCEQLLKLATEETHSVLRKRLCDVIAEVARASIGILYFSFFVYGIFYLSFFHFR